MQKLPLQAPDSVTEWAESQSMYLEPDSWNVSDGVSSPTKPSNEHLILH